MKEVLGILFLCLFTLTSCSQGGFHSTYIISEHANEEEAPPSYDEEEARY